MAAAAAETGLSIDLLSMPSWSNLKEPECGVRLESAVKVLSIVNSGLLGVLGGVSKTEVLPSLSTVISKKDIFRDSFDYRSRVTTYLSF